LTLGWSGRGVSQIYWGGLLGGKERGEERSGKGGRITKKSLETCRGNSMR